VLAPEPDAPQEFCASVVPAIGAEGERVLDALRALATKLRAKRAYTNTSTFDLKCEVSGFFLLVFARVLGNFLVEDFLWCQVCGQGLKGEKEARAHASETGHAKFGEY
jgi:ubiquitin thioesterase OTU1